MTIPSASDVSDSSPPRRPAPLPSTITIADEGARLRRLTRLLFAVLWLVPGAIAGIGVWFTARDGAYPIALSTALFWQICCWMLWAVWSQGVLTLVDRVPLVRGRIWPWMATHLLSSMLVMSASALVVGWIDWHLAPWAATYATYADALAASATRRLDTEFMLYWAVLGAAYMVEFVRRYRERDRDATELEEELSRQQIEALRLQLNPHFLFNALNSVAELMEMDVREAQRALSAVGDLLRLSLRTAGTPTIPLWREIELVELYLQVARVRYGEGLALDIDVDPAAVDVEVPSFVLQPLIENALKHGLSPGHVGQSVHVTARRDGPMLELRVLDNGRGLNGRITDSGRFLAASPNLDGLGIGLTNTRTRLAMLYGERFAFRMSNTTGGGCLVEIRLPVHR